MLFFRRQHFFRRTNAGVQDDASDSCQVLTVFVKGRKEAILLVRRVLVQPSLTILPRTVVKNRGKMEAEFSLNGDPLR